MLIRMSATPRICLRIWSSMRVKAKMAIVETTINVISIGHSRFQVTYSLSRHTMTAEVVMANSPESVVASPYVGRKNGSIVIMKMPKPKPVVRCTKQAQILSRNMAMTRLLIVVNILGCKDSDNSAIRSHLGVSLFLFISLHVSAQNRYCLTYDDFVFGKWVDFNDSINLKSIHENRLAYTLKSDNKELRKMLSKSSFAMYYSDSLYINLKELKFFGDLFVRAWKLKDSRIMFARPDIVPSGGVFVGNNGINIPMSSKVFKSKSKMKNLVCYILNKNDDQLKFERVTEEAVLDLIKDDNKTLEYYRTFDSKRRDNADVVTEVLLEAGVIE